MSTPMPGLDHHAAFDISTASEPGELKRRFTTPAKETSLENGLWRGRTCEKGTECDAGLAAPLRPAGGGWPRSTQAPWQGTTSKRRRPRFCLGEGSASNG